MPTGNISKMPQLWIINPDGTKIMLGDVHTMNTIVDPCYSYDEVPRVSADTREYEYTVKWVPNTKALYFMFYGRFPANNWLRLHGYRAERKERKSQNGQKRKRC